MKVIGGGVGAYFGGPAGATAGMSIGGALEGGPQQDVPGATSRPTDPAQMFVDDQGMLRDRFQTGKLTNTELESGKGLLGNLKDRATAQGPSQSAQYLQGASDLQSQAQKDQLGRNQSSQLATQQANLAMKGGMTSGARERMAGSMANQNVMANQGINQQNALNKMNTLAQDEQQKLGLMKDLGGQYRAYGNDQMNRQVSDTQGGMNILQGKYEADMKGYAANEMARQQAEAANNANKGLLGGILG